MKKILFSYAISILLLQEGDLQAAETVKNLLTPLPENSSQKLPSEPPPFPSGHLPLEAFKYLSYAPLVKITAPAVVSIMTRQFPPNANSSFANDPLFSFFFGKTLLRNEGSHPQHSLGSGVIVDDTGIVITCVHVIQNAKKIRIKLADNREYDAEPKISDESNDLVALQITGLGKDQKLPFLPLADAERPEVGDVVLGIGNPFGIGQTVTKGIVSALARSVNGHVLLQTDAPINPGNSGGALVDMSGRLMGIPNVILSRTGSSHGVGFAIPATIIKPLLEAAKNNGKIQRYWDGIITQSVTQTIADSLELSGPQGIIVVSLHPLSPALKAGLKKGDVLTHLNGKPIFNEEDFFLNMKTIHPHSTLTLTALRQRTEIKISYELIPAPEIPEAQITTFASPHVLAHVTVANLSPALALEHNLSLKQDGVVILQAEDSLFSSSLLAFQKGDIIQSINDKPITSVDQLKSLDFSLSPLLLTLRRGASVVTIQVK